MHERTFSLENISRSRALRALLFTSNITLRSRIEEPISLILW